MSPPTESQQPTTALDEQDAEHVDQQLAQARQYQANGQHQKAVNLYQDICNHHPSVHQAWGNLGISLAALGQKEPAIQALERALEIQPDYDLAHRNLAGIKRVSAAQLRQPGAITFKTSVLEIGIRQDAIDEWVNLLNTADLRQIAALQDTAACLTQLAATPAPTDKNNFFAIATIQQLNQLLTEPDPLEFTAVGLEENTKTESTIHFDHEPQFPTVWRLHHLLTTAHLIEKRNEVTTVTDNFDQFQHGSAAEQYANLLWCYFHDLSWPDMETAARPDAEDQEMKSFNHAQTDMVRIIHRQTSHRLEQFMNAAGSRGSWVDPLATADIPFEPELDKEQTDATVAILTMLVFNEDRYLWTPLEWFGLVNRSTRPGFLREPMLNNVRPTALGQRLLSTLAVHNQESSTPTTPPVGRNDPCPCGAAKPNGQPRKYKKCHGR